MICFGCYEKQTLWLGVEGQSLVFSRLLIWSQKTFHMSRLSEEKWPWHGWLWIIIKSASFLSIFAECFSLSTCQLHSGKKQAEQSRQHQLCVRQPSEVTYMEATFLPFFFALCRWSHLVSRVSDTGINWRNKLKPELTVNKITQGQSLLG